MSETLAATLGEYKANVKRKLPAVAHAVRVDTKVIYIGVMLEPAKPHATGQITAAAVICIVASGFSILLLIFVIFAVVFAASQQPSQFPGAVRNMAVAFLIVFLGAAIFGVITGIGLLRLKNWARISALVWAGISALFSLFPLIFLFFMPMPASPNTTPAVMGLIRWIVGGFYALPLIVSVWWLLLFNQAAVRERFTALEVAAEPGFPSVSRKPELPLALTILAWLFVVSAVLSSPFMLLGRTPVLFFGHLISGPSGKALFLLNCLLFLTAGIGILKRKSWTYTLIIASQVFWLVSGIVTFFTPNHRVLMEAAVAASLASWNLPHQTSSANLARNVNFGVFFGLGFGVVILGILLYYRSRFLALASASSQPIESQPVGVA